MSKYETNNLKARILAKGWTIQDAALYLGISRQRLYSVMADPERVRLWECAVTGLPHFTDVEARIIQRIRHRPPQPKKSAPVTISRLGLALGDGVTVQTPMECADEGADGWIAAIQPEGRTQSLLIELPGGQEWIPLESFHHYFVANGKTRPPG